MDLQLLAMAAHRVRAFEAPRPSHARAVTRRRGPEDNYHVPARVRGTGYNDITYAINPAVPAIVRNITL